METWIQIIKEQLDRFLSDDNVPTWKKIAIKLLLASVMRTPNMMSGSTLAGDDRTSEAAAIAEASVYQCECYIRQCCEHGGVNAERLSNWSNSVLVQMSRQLDQSLRQMRQKGADFSQPAPVFSSSGEQQSVNQPQRPERLSGESAEPNQNDPNIKRDDGLVEQKSFDDKGNFRSGNQDVNNPVVGTDPKSSQEQKGDEGQKDQGKDEGGQKMAGDASSTFDKAKANQTEKGTDKPASSQTDKSPDTKSDAKGQDDKGARRR